MGNFLSEVRRLGNDLEIKNGLSIAVFMEGQTLATLKNCNEILEGNAVSLGSNLLFVLMTFLAGYFLGRQVRTLQQLDKYMIKVKFVNKGVE